RGRSGCTGQRSGQRGAAQGARDEPCGGRQGDGREGRFQGVRRRGRRSYRSGGLRQVTARTTNLSNHADGRRASPASRRRGFVCQRTSLRMSSAATSAPAPISGNFTLGSSSFAWTLVLALSASRCGLAFTL